MQDKKTLLLYFMTGIIALSLIGLGVFSYFNLNAKVEVVDFSDYTVTEIEKWSKDNGVKYELDYQFDDEIEKEKVVSQSIPAKQMIRSKDVLKIVISLGPDPDLVITLPDFTGYTYDQIVEFVTQNKLLDVTYDYAENDEIEKDVFVEHNVKTPTMKRSDMIIFTLSLGESDESKEIEVPDFSTFTRNQITNWGNVNNVFIKFVEVTSTTVAEGKYIKQSPVAGALIYEKRTITITYSSGQPIKAIDLSGKTKIQVIQWLDDNDNRVYAKYYESYNSDVNKNVVISNSPNSGYLADGSTISVYLSLGKPSLDSFVGKDYALLTSAVNSLNDKGAKLVLDLKSQYDDTVEKGKLISQDKSGELAVGTKITAVYSKGRQITITDQTGKTFGEFSTYCSTNKLVLGTKTEKYHSTYAANIIISHIPAAGEKVDEGTKINYVLSLGQYTPENFVGKTYSYASGKITEVNAKDAGWTIVRVDDYNNSYNKDVIYEQSIDGKTLTVKVSKGSSVTIGNYVGQNKGELPTIPGVEFVLVAGDYDSNPFGYITAQSKDAGTYPSPLSVTITYSKGAIPTATIPAFMSTYTTTADPYVVYSEITASLTGLGFTNFSVILEHNFAEVTSEGVVFAQSHKGTQPLNVPLVIKIEHNDK